MKWSFIIKYRYIVIITMLFLLHIFFSFYQLERRANLDWDQVNDAWVALRILIEHKLPLLGVEVKGNSGMYIGPLYYYFISIFYFLTRLDPIASPIIAACTSIFGFLVILFVSKGLFNKRTSCIALFIYTFCFFIIQYERVQVPVNFIAPFSLLIFYFLYKIIIGYPKYIVHLGLLTGLSLHIHFTSLFYPIIIVFSLPFFPWKKHIVPYLVGGLLLFLMCLIPQIIYYVTHSNSAGNYSTYFQSYYHGFHLTRMLQLRFDAFIQFFSILELPYRFLRNVIYVYIPLFFLAYTKKQTLKKSLPLTFLIGLWILVPWVIFTTYKGEITNYYFFLHLYLAILIFAYLTDFIIEMKTILPKILVILFWSYFAISNVRTFFQVGPGNLIRIRSEVKKTVQYGLSYPYTAGDLKYYLYYVSTRNK